jgi:glutamate 5-kinase
LTRSELTRARRVVVKVGTSLLTTESGDARTRRFQALASDIAAASDGGRDLVLVTSGAVGLGTRRLGWAARPQAIPDKQAAAAIGQIDLCRRWERAFARHGRAVGQILLTHVGLADRERFLNARHTIQTLLREEAIPIINENDSVATEELRFGDNDHLASLVVNVSGADLLVLLTDIDGVHDRHPGLPGARRIPVIDEVTPEVLALCADGPGSDFGSGGMRTKLEAARAVARFGVPTVIAAGRRREPLRPILAGEDIGTLVRPAPLRLSSRKHWIAYSLKPRGTVHLDHGAERALIEQGRSLLPIGVVAVEGRFRIGDPVSCVNAQGKEVARGLASYDSRETDMIKGHRSPQIRSLLGYSNGDAIIHRDDLVLLS